MTRYAKRQGRPPEQEIYVEYPRRSDHDQSDGLLDTVDLNQSPVRVADDVIVWPTLSQGRRVYRLEIPTLHRYYEIGSSEYVFLSLLDGSNTLAQACGLAAAQLGNEAITSEQAESMVRWLLDEQLAYLPDSGTPTRDAKTSGDVPHTKLLMGKQSALLKRFNPFWIKLPLMKQGGRGAAALQRLGGTFGWLFATIPLLFGCVLIVIAGISLWIHGLSVLQPAKTLFSPDNWFWLLVTWVLLKLIHETAHAAACHRVGGVVREMGVVLVLLAPMAYVDVSSVWRIASRRKRMLVSAAGVYVEWVIASVALMLLLSIDAPHWQWMLNNIALTAGVSTFLFNANVLMRFDGYYVLSDWVQIPNLYTQSQGELKRLVQRYAFDMPTHSGRTSGWRWWFCVFYGIAALIWKVLVCTTLIIAASTMFAGAGVVLAVLGGGMWIGQPAFRFIRFAREQWRFDRARLVRAAAAVVGCCVMTMAILLWMPIPTSVRFHGVVTYASQTIVRSGVDGFVTDVHVADRQRVRSGDLLLEIENQSLLTEISQLKLLLEENQWRRRAANDRHDPSTLGVLDAKADSLEKQIAELQAKAATLRLLAPRDGIVVARNLRSRLATFVREGDELMAIVGEGEREVTALIHQDDIHLVRAQLGKPVLVTDPGDTLYQGTLVRIEPRASHRLTHPALAATRNGPLSVEQADQEPDQEPDQRADQQAELQLSDAYFTARVTLDSRPDGVASRLDWPAEHSMDDVIGSQKALASGMRTVIHAGYRSDSLSRRLQIAIERLWYQAAQREER
ncbi:HlyD family efflux transporter periplasmic adaptor subunit [Stieleria varia]|uniref:Uncharacterized protein n=1 Tax=Stieleria varia TaxID=2528005 RepID=A0A5C6B852_9BACT|nr:HlyD family efflux transporter periplasmic adaptor subunit [Stieleria varia]TWU08263.1 hypothetical protein Pla52n_08450 [Stieleria varia]